ncbi:EAL domain-containing protein [Bisbaumannia pacifica]|uniref:EAL domain-containing protein n=1 Tax=Bisbaumannia pacifica TaxID=77098 RepID=A0ABD4L6Z3_9GAMM|nr:EAL domain-containing protein [Halomonas pacifica]MBH8581514.1 EAL domain-containing protein [Halomonas pacifica]
MTLGRLLFLLGLWCLLGWGAPALAIDRPETLIIAPGSPGQPQDAALVRALTEAIEARGQRAEVAYLRHQQGQGLPGQQALALAISASRIVLLHEPALRFYRQQAQALGSRDLVAYGIFGRDQRDWLAARGIALIDLAPVLRRSLAWVMHREATLPVLWSVGEAQESRLAPYLAEAAEFAGRRLRWERLSRDPLPRSERRLASGEVRRDQGFLVAPPTPQARRQAEALRRLGWRLWCLDPAWLPEGCLGGIIADETAVAAQLLDALDGVSSQDGDRVVAAAAAPRLHYAERSGSGGQDVTLFGLDEAQAERQRRGGWLVAVAVGAGVLALLLLLLAGWAEVRRRQRRRLLQLDERTRLPEWPALEARMSRYLQQAYPFQLCWIGFDRLAALEASGEAEPASRLLPAVAQRLRKLVGSQAYLARLDEGAFAVMGCFPDEPQARLFMERLQRGLEDSIELGGERQWLLPRLGVAVSEGDSPRALLLAARNAADQVPDDGARRPAWFRPGDVDRPSQQAALLEEFRRGAVPPAEQLRVLVNPLYRLSSRQLAGGTFRLEWQHPRWGRMTPATWRPLARLSQQILGLERYLISVGLRQLSQQALPPGLSWCFPLAAEHLESPMFSDWLEARCEEQGVPPGRIELCLDGLALPPGETAWRNLKRLRELGMGLSVEGEARGPELQALLRLPLSVLRLPGEMIRTLPGDQRALLLLKGIRDTAVMLGVRILVTELDDEERLSCLRGLGYQWGSGPLLGPPDSLASLLQRQGAGVSDTPPR